MRRCSRLGRVHPPMTPLINFLLGSLRRAPAFFKTHPSGSPCGSLGVSKAEDEMTPCQVSDLSSSLLAHQLCPSSRASRPSLASDLLKPWPWPPAPSPSLTAPSALHCLLSTSPVSLTAPLVSHLCSLWTGCFWAAFCVSALLFPELPCCCT